MINFSDYGHNRVAKALGITLPIVQAPMNWLTDARLVAAVSNAGGLGVLGPNAGQTELTRDMMLTLERMRQEIRKTRALTILPFGLNVLTLGDPTQPLDDFTQQWLSMAFEEGITHYVVVGQLHASATEQIQQHGGKVLFRPLNPSVEVMQAAERMKVDVVIATGTDEGGVLPEHQWGTFTVVPAMVDAVSIPVLGAGGINDVRGARAMFALGAEGLYVGTRFAVTKESPIADVTKQKIIDSGYADMLQVSALQRSLRTSEAERIAALYADPNFEGNADAEISKSGGMRPAMLLGHFDEGIISTNTGIDVIRTTPTVAELIAELLELPQE